MKTLTMIFVYLLVSMSTVCSQELELTRKERRFLDSLSLSVIRKFGEDGYYKMARKEKSVIILKNYESDDQYNGREYYEVSYYQDSTKDVRLEWNHIAQVVIWEDTKEAYAVNFGNGYGYGDLPKMLEDEKAGKKIKRMPFVLVDYKALEEKWREVREANERMYRQKIEESLERSRKEREERERQDSVRNSLSRDSVENQE